MPNISALEDFASLDFAAGAAPLNALQPTLIQMTWLGRLVESLSELTVAAGGGCAMIPGKGGRQSSEAKAGAAVSQLPGSTSEGGSCGSARSCRDTAQGASSGRGQESDKMEILGIISRTRRRSPDSGNNFK